jgi:hypothetical protein
VILIASLGLRDLLSGTIKDILAGAAARHDRRIEISTPDDTHKPILCCVDTSSRYKNDSPPQLGKTMLNATVDLRRMARMIDVTNFG